jgi:hypothetical protein
LAFFAKRDSRAVQALIKAWSAKRTASVACGMVGASGVNNGAYLGTNTTSGQWLRMYRWVNGFDTSSIPDTDTVSSATYNLYSRTTGSAFAQSVVVDHPTPASPSALVVGDYNISGRWDSVEQATSRIPLTTWTAGEQYRTFTLNSTGLANISKTGITFLGLRLSGDFDNVEPTWASSATADAGLYDSAQDGVNKDPYLEVVTLTNSLLVESLTNPSNISTSSPRFSAIHINASTTALATDYQIQIATSSAFIMSPTVTNLNDGQALPLASGDLNDDNAINSADYSIAQKAFGATPSSSNWNDNIDLNKDGVVNVIDLSIISKNLGAVGASGAWTSPLPNIATKSAEINTSIGSPNQGGYWIWVPAGF